MKLNEFLEKLKLANHEPSFYQSGGWGKWNGSKWGWDCVCMVKGILWGWNNDKSKPRGGGAIYGSNGVPDCGTEKMISLCKNVSTNFNKIEAGELLWQQGHVGVYIGDGVVIESTVAFGGGCVKSKINSKGQRLNYTTGKNAGPDWKKHGFLPWVDYTKEPDPKPDEWVAGGYKLIVAKTIRTSTKVIVSNRVKVKNCTSETKKHLTSTNGNAIAVLKVGAEVLISKIIKESNGRIWGQYGNCYIVLCNKDGSKQAKRI